jgi:predicted metal-dependent peptidase
MNEVPGVAAARLWAASRLPYLASAVFAVQPRPAPGIGTVAVDQSWRLWVDAEVSAGWSPAQFGSVLVHHVCHLLRAHGERARAAGVAPDGAPHWIRCADAEINDDLVPAGLELPGEPVLPRHLGGQPGRLAEEYYSAGAARASRQTGGWDLDCGSGADGCDRPWEGRPGAEPGLKPWQARLLCRLTAREILRHSREIGSVPAGLARWATGLLEPKVDWRRALAAEVRKAVADVSGAVDYTYRRPSRRAAVAGDVVLPALRRPLPEVAVVCDTSGSMTEDLLAASLAEVEGLLRALGLARRLRVIACDAAASAAQKVTSARQVELTGGGGTDMGAGIAAATALRPRPAITVVLTDGLTPWPDAPPQGMKVVVGLLGDEPPEPPAWTRAIRVPARD